MPSLPTRPLRAAGPLLFTLAAALALAPRDAAARAPHTPLVLSLTPQDVAAGHVALRAEFTCPEVLPDVRLAVTTDAGDAVTLRAGAIALAEPEARAAADAPGCLRREYVVRVDGRLALDLQVEPRGDGPHRVRVTALAARSGGDTWGDGASYFYVQRGGVVSAGWPASPTDGLAHRVPEGEHAKPAAPAATDAATAGQLVVEGTWLVYDQAGNVIPQIEREVHLLNGAGQVIGFTYTDLSGFYRFAPVTNPGTVATRVATQARYSRNGGTDQLRVANQSSALYTVTTPFDTGVPDGTHTMGGWSPLPGSDAELATWAFNAVQDTWRYLYFLHGDGSHSPGSMTAQWYPGSTDGTYYSGGGVIHLAHDDPRSRHTVTHEAGHNAMYNAYNGWWPTDDCPSPHYIQYASGIHCAWTEGWADWVSLAVTGNPVYTWPSGSTLDLETASALESGDTVEGNLAAAMWDWIDSANERDLDNHTDPPAPLWDTVWNHRDQTICDYWDSTRHQGIKRSRDDELFHNRITQCTLCLEDFGEADNSCAAARNLPPGGVVSDATFCHDPDYRGTLVERDWNYVWATDDLGALGDTVLTLFDAACDPENTLAYSDDTYAGLWPRSSRIDWRSDRDGMVYLEAWNFGGYGSNRSYDLSLTRYCAVPTVPVPTWPPDGASLCGSDVTLAWQTDGTQHAVIVDGGYRWPCIGITARQCALTGLAPGLHWWAVQTELRCGNSVFSPQYHFEVLDPDAAPGAVEALDVLPDAVQWPAVAQATGYDVVRGDVRLLLDGAGDFQAATVECLAAATPGLATPFAFVPDPGEAAFVLTRARGCTVPGTFDEPPLSQSGARDPGIAASAGSCP